MSFELEFNEQPPEQTKQWMGVEVTGGFKNEQHIVPVEDEWNHTFDTQCHCHPISSWEIGIDKILMVMHNSWDCREYHDPTAELPDRHRME